MTKKIDNYLARVDKLYNDSTKINSTPVFITSITAEGHRELIFMLNYSLMSHCKLKKYFGASKAGHSGTLDPLATGVLVVYFDDMTKIIPFIDEQPPMTLPLG